MTKLVIDAAMSIDGFWADAAGNSLFPVAEMHEAGAIAELVARTGAVIMSGRSFGMVDDPNWYACNYEHQVPIFVVADALPDRHPKEDCGLSFEFTTTFADALVRARASAHGKDVMVMASDR